MTEETMRKLQEQFVKEAAAVLAKYGADASTKEWEEGIAFVGEACGIPQAETLGKLASIVLERRLLAEGGGKHIYSGEELNNNLSSLDTLGFVWDILEASTAVQEQQKRRALYDLAFQFADIHGLREFLEEYGRTEQPDEKEQDEAPKDGEKETSCDCSTSV